MAFIYSLACPKTGAIRYIGKADKPFSRFKSHLISARRNKYINTTYGWIRELLAEGLEPELKVLLEVPAGTTWQAAEIACIAEHLAAGCTLTNVRAGGNGQSFLRPEEKDAFGLTMSACWNRPGSREIRTQKIREAFAKPESKARRVAAQNTPETKALKSAALKEAFSKPGAAESRSERSKAAQGTPEARARRSELSTAFWADPVKRAAAEEKRREWAAALRVDPERSAKKSAALKAAYAKPEVKARWVAACANNHSAETNAKRAAKLKSAWAEPGMREKWLQSFSTDEAKAANSRASKATWAKRKGASG